MSEWDKSDEEQLLEEEDTLSGRFLTFLLANESYGIEIKYVKEIIGLQPITEVPELPDYVKGIINLRGIIIPVIDVRLRFKKPFKEYTDRTCVVVVDIGERLIGLIVDCVSEVLSIPKSAIVPPPEIHQAGNRFIQGIGKVGTEVKILLDCCKLLDEEIDSLSSIYIGGS